MLWKPSKTCIIFYSFWSVQVWLLAWQSRLENCHSQWYQPVFSLRQRECRFMGWSAMSEEEPHWFVILEVFFVNPFVCLFICLFVCLKASDLVGCRQVHIAHGIAFGSIPQSQICFVLFFGSEICRTHNLYILYIYILNIDKYWIYVQVKTTCPVDVHLDLNQSIDRLNLWLCLYVTQVFSIPSTLRAWS
jgi:hypothetical protein